MKGNKQKKRTWVWNLLVIIGGSLGIGGVLLVLQKIGALLMAYVFAAMLVFVGGESYDLLLTFTSPSGEYVLEALRENTPAIEPYYLEVNLLDGDEKRTIYYVRGQSEAEIVWLSDTVAEINGVPVNVTSGECFEANACGYFKVNVQVKAPDVRRLEMTVCMDREPRITKHGVSVPLAEDVDGWGVSARLNVLQELHWDDDFAKKKAGLTVTLDTMDGERITLPYLWEWTAKEYGSYNFLLTGSAEDGYTLTPGDFVCTVADKCGCYNTCKIFRDGLTGLTISAIISGRKDVMI